MNCHRYADSAGFSGGCLLDYAMILDNIIYIYVHLYINFISTPSMKPFLKQKGLFSIDHSKHPDFLWGFCPHKRTIGPLFLPNEKRSKKAPKQTKISLAFFVIFWFTLQGTNISPKNGILKMIFLFPRWDMLIPWRVCFSAPNFAPWLKADLDSGYGNLSSCTHPEDLDYNTEPWTEARGVGEDEKPHFWKKTKPGGAGNKTCSNRWWFHIFMFTNNKT